MPAACKQLRSEATLSAPAAARSFPLTVGYQLHTTAPCFALHTTAPCFAPRTRSRTPAGTLGGTGRLWCSTQCTATRGMRPAHNASRCEDGSAAYMAGGTELGLVGPG